MNFTKGFGTTLLYAVFFLYFIFSLLALATELRNPLWGSDALSEWLVNYQGGFVRRGFAGEILFQLYSLFNIKPEIIIISISLISMLWLSWIFIKSLARVGIPLYYAVLPLVGVTIFYYHPHFSGFRKDPLLLLIVYYSVKHLFNFQKSKKIISFIYWQMLLILGVFLHEAFLFYGVLIQLAIFYFSANEGNAINWVKKSALLLPLFIAILANFLNKGNEVVAERIFKSWRPYLESQYGDQVSVDKMLSIKALGWKTLDTIKFHLDLNFFKTDNFGIPAAFFFILIFFVVIYVFANCKFKFKDLSQVDNFNIFLTIWLTVFVAMTPLFTVLSCDYLRLFAYLNFTAIFVYDRYAGIFSSDGGILNTMKPIARSVSSILYHPRHKWIFHKFFFIIIIFLFLTYSPAGIELDSAFTGSIFGKFYQKANRLWEILLH